MRTQPFGSARFATAFAYSASADPPADAGTYRRSTATGTPPFSMTTSSSSRRRSVSPR